MKAISLLLILAACASQPKEDPEKAIAVPLIGKHPGIRECYTNSSSYLRNEGAEAMLKVEFEVNKDGSTMNHKMLSSTVNEPRFHACIINSLKTLRYPPQNEPFIVEQSFTLTPDKK